MRGTGPDDRRNSRSQIPELLAGDLFRLKMESCLVLKVPWVSYMKGLLSLPQNGLV